MVPQGMEETLGVNQPQRKTADIAIQRLLPLIPKSKLK